jgi:hypothetical protein
MIQVDLPVALGVGSLMAHAAQRQILSKQPAALNDAFAKVVIFHFVAFSWPPMYLLVFYFGFETSHMWWHEDSVLAYPWLLPVFYLALFLANLAGFAIGAKLVSAGRATWALLLWLATVLFTVGWVLLLPDRTMTIGTYRDWQAGIAPPGSSDPTFLWFVIVVMVGYSAGVWLVYRSLRRDGLAAAGAPGS